MSSSLNTVSVGKVAHYFKELDSTNAEALRRLRRSPYPAPGTLIHAGYQTAGRGQASNRWHATANLNLLYSIILYPNHFKVSDIFRLTQVASLAVAAAVQQLLAGGEHEVSIKWPNDIYLNKRKVAGLLIQNSLQGRNLQWSVIGIGLNINENQFPPALQATATSLREWTPGQIPLNLDRCLSVCTATLTAYINRYNNTESFAALKEAYHQKLYRKDQLAPYQRLDESAEMLTATIRGVTASGLLRLEKSDGQEELFDLKSIRFL